MKRIKGESRELTVERFRNGQRLTCRHSEVRAFCGPKEPMGLSTAAVVPTKCRGPFGRLRAGSSLGVLGEADDSAASRMTDGRAISFQRDQRAACTTHYTFRWSGDKRPSPRAAPVAAK